ncbi:MAG: Inosine-5'-monophosphate dehydrogenase [Methanonatronarchaeales archaeon]|nr:Inosine-5'-monophosphate dehydrogenase [Methanonatronarchaeales archaeon]
MELTPAQKEIIMALINLSRDGGGAVKGEAIAGMVGRNPGTVRNQMQSLKALELVEGVPGPKGGYKPTHVAYEALDLDELTEEAPVDIYDDGKLVKGASVTEVDFTTIQHPDICRGAVRVLGDLGLFDAGDEIVVGPTPVNRMYIKGTVTGRDEVDNLLMLDIAEIQSIPKKKISEVASMDLTWVDADETVQQAASRFLERGIEGAPVRRDDSLVGIVTFTDLGKAVAESSVDKLVEEVMTPEPESVSLEMSLVDVIRLMDEKDIGRLVVTDDGESIGIVTRTDVLRRLAVTGGSTGS